jgi:hypothetical protein
MDTAGLGIHAAVALANAAAVLACILIHYEGLSLVSRLMVRLKHVPRRQKVLYTVLGVLVLHVIEIWLFGATLWACLQLPDAGGIAGAEAGSLLDAVYLSASSYTTVGFGDVAPLGPIRFVAGTEALVGFVMITWSASFTFIEMQRYWKPD